MALLLLPLFLLHFFNAVVLHCIFLWNLIILYHKLWQSLCCVEVQARIMGKQILGRIVNVFAFCLSAWSCLWKKAVCIHLLWDLFSCKPVTNAWPDWFLKMNYPDHPKEINIASLQHCTTTLQRCTLILNVWPLHMYSNASSIDYLHYVPTFNGLWLKAMHW